MPNISTPDTEGEKAGTNGLLDEATRLADDWRALHEGDVLRALVERVRAAEAERDRLARAVTTLDRTTDELADAVNALQGKLDDVRALCDATNARLPLVTFGGHVQPHLISTDDVRAVIDAEGSTP